MKKYILIISAALFLSVSNSCSDRDLELLPLQADEIASIDTEARLQQMLNGAYMNIASKSALGSDLLIFGDILGDKMYNTPSTAIFLQTGEYSYNPIQSQFGFYGTLYRAIMSSNIVINNTLVDPSTETERMKGEAKIIRGFAYFLLVSYYSPTPTSGVNQEYGVPLVLEDYNLEIQPARATVAQVYDQVIKDLTEGMNETSFPKESVNLGSDAAKLLLSRVYLTRRAPGDAQLALQYADEVIANAPKGVFTSTNTFAFTPESTFSATNYRDYFLHQDQTKSEKQPETIWELDVNPVTNAYTGIGENGSLPVYYSGSITPEDDPEKVNSPRRCLLATAAFFSSFPTADARRGGPVVATPAGSLFSNAGMNNIADNPKGYWINKYPQVGFQRDTKILRYSEAYLNRIEALRLTGQEALALTELNKFATSRKGTVYTAATDLLQNILTERAKEFYGEGQRFLDLKRYNLPVVRTTNCNTCTLEASDKRFVLPMSESALNQNRNLTQYPGY